MTQVITLTDGAEKLVEAFNLDADKVRVLLLTSPT